MEILCKKRTCLLAAFCFLLILMLIGSLFDAPISALLYHPGNAFGTFFAGFGEYPAPRGVVAAGSMLFSAAQKETSYPLRPFLTAGGCCLIAAGGCWLLTLPGKYMDISPLAVAAVGLTCATLTVLFILRMCRDADKTALLGVAAAFLLVIAADVILVNVLKSLWGRPRMRLIASDPRAYFIPWWRPDTSLRDTLTASGVAAGEFRSFPSGHTANASCLMLLSLLPKICPKLTGRQTLLFSIGFLWALLVAFSRITVGAHFLTDTAAGCAIVLTAITFTQLPLLLKGLLRSSKN